jgi:hypothetical protein
MEKIPENLFFETFAVTVKHSSLSHTLIMKFVRAFIAGNHKSNL